ncbi:rhomboid family intramembrane serine protease [Limimaricola sp.]|uniref:rhomboid family intramembrane serine protease n=1 Tax=Limimaricola sp. TaxID=2211665 RepID=UPI00405920F8
MFPIRDHNPSQAKPWVTWSLIAINVAIYLWMVVALDTGEDLARLYYDWAMIPARLSQAENPVALVSALFLHGGILHLAGNMLFLFIFGDNLEEQMGHGLYLGFYLASGIAANLAQFGTEPFSPIPTIGASGAIAGVMGGYLLMFPRARIDVLVFLIVILKLVPVPAWAVLAVWFGLQVLGGIGADAATGGVAYWAHAGGFAVGLVLALPLWLRRGGPAFWARTHGVPPHAAAPPLGRSNIPVVRRRR